MGAQWKQKGRDPREKLLVFSDGMDVGSIEETYRLAQDWQPDMANWNMYTPWPFAELFEELGDAV